MMEGVDIIVMMACVYDSLVTVKTPMSAMLTQKLNL
jgi:hypothetical protein